MSSLCAAISAYVYRYLTTNLANYPDFISGDKIEKIPFDKLFNGNATLILQKIPVASFATFKLVASQADHHMCICVRYKIRKVHGYSTV